MKFANVLSQHTEKKRESLLGLGGEEFIVIPPKYHKNQAALIRGWPLKRLISKQIQCSIFLSPSQLGWTDKPWPNMDNAT